MLSVKRALGIVNCQFCIETCHGHHHRGFVEPNLRHLGGLLERFGSQVDLSLSHLKDSRATLESFGRF